MGYRNCFACHGKGVLWSDGPHDQYRGAGGVCTNCEGTGQVEDENEITYKNCFACHGEGTLWSDGPNDQYRGIGGVCTNCGGTGQVEA